MAGLKSKDQPMNNKYTILSIGPIYDTLKIADNTRAIWTVSFIFSYLMRETIRYLVNKEKISKENFLVPHYTDTFEEKYMQDGQSIGIFHDRLILKGEFAQKVDNAFKNSLENLAEIVWQTFKKTEEKDFKYVQVDVDETKVKDFIRGYFQSYIAQVDIEADKNPILELSKYVDAIEYEPKLAQYEEKEYLFLFLRLTNLSLLKEVAFGEEAYKVLKDRCFKSLPEISAYELLNSSDEIYKKYKENYLCLTIEKLKQLKERGEEDALFDLLKKEFGDRFKPYHKYVAIVHGDGDSFGKHLKSTGANENQIKEFSDNIFSFLIEARDIIENYGGHQLVGSGEDLLFFAPVINEKENIFTLINKIDTVFKKYFGNTKLSMSYGISVTYYKFPLQEALELSADALWSYAKESKWISTSEKKESAKNAIHIVVQKHSGQTHRLTLHKNSTLYDSFVKLTNEELSDDTTIQLPHSLHHSLQTVDTIINIIDKENIEHFFTNMFNENIHKVKHKKALEALEEILVKLKDKKSDEVIHLVDDNGTTSLQKPSKTLFSMLSVIKMLRGDK